MADHYDADVERQLALTDLVNRVLDRGVTIVGDITISVAGIDLVYLGLALDVAAVEPNEPGRGSVRLAALTRGRIGARPSAE